VAAIFDEGEEPGMEPQQAVGTGTPSAQWVCNRCGWVYDPAQGDPDGHVPPRTPFKDVPADWCCPSCGADRDYFIR
jgi:rubredoxin